MRFSNRTPLQAAMIPNAESDDRITALFLCAITHRVERGRLEIAPEQRRISLHHDGPHPPDAMFDKAGVSVCATGFVYPKQPQAREAMAVLRVGSRDVPIAVFGQRVWQKSLLAGGLVPSTPLPFERVEMSWENAYGGMTEEPARILQMDGEEVFVPEHEGGYALNFNGKGFLTDPQRAVDQPLPQLEHPEQFIQRWDDRPEPVCFAPYPLWGGMRSVHVYHDRRFDMAGTKKIVNRAAPRTTFDVLEPGTTIALLGMRPGAGLLSFDVPRSPVAIDLEIGGRADRILPSLDSVDIDADASEVRLLYRATVTYDLIQFELRRARLEPTEYFPEA
jgi:hypothetical protein